MRSEREHGGSPTPEEIEKMSLPEREAAAKNEIAELRAQWDSEETKAAKNVAPAAPDDGTIGKFAKWWDAQSLAYARSRMDKETKGEYLSGGEVREQFTHLLDLWSKQEPEVFGEALTKLSEKWRGGFEQMNARAAQEGKEPYEDVMDYVKKTIAGQRSKILEGSLVTRQSATEAMAQLKEMTKKYLVKEGAIGQAKGGGPERLPLIEGEPVGEDDLTDEARSIATDALGSDTKMIEAFQAARRETTDRPLAESADARRDFVRSMFEERLPELAEEYLGRKDAGGMAAEVVTTFIAAMRKRYDDIVARGQTPEERNEWRALVLDAGAEILRDQINRSKLRESSKSDPGKKRIGSDDAVANFFTKMSEAMSDVSALKALRNPKRKAA